MNKLRAYMYRVVFYLALPYFSTKKKITSQSQLLFQKILLLTTKKGHDWLLGNFLFATETQCVNTRNPL